MQEIVLRGPRNGARLNGNRLLLMNVDGCISDKREGASTRDAADAGGTVKDRPTRPDKRVMRTVAITLSGGHQVGCILK